MGEWRRAASTCAGALVLWLKDMLPGAGLGVSTTPGMPKVALHYLRRALAPVAVWTSDEGVAGVAVHIANDRPEPLEGTLRVALYRDWEIPVAEAHGGAVGRAAHDASLTASSASSASSSIRRGRIDSGRRRPT